MKHTDDTQKSTSIGGPTRISVVVPAKDEAENLPDLYREVREVCEREGYEWEMIVVDDGSHDETPQVARELPGITFVRFRRNFGQTAALDAGLKRRDIPTSSRWTETGRTTPPTSRASSRS